MEISNCPACEGDMISLFEIKEGREIWLCWNCGTNISIPHRFRSNVGADLCVCPKKEK